MMVEWTPDLAVGNAEIDGQHKELFERVNTLLEAMREGRGRGEVHQTLDYLERYVVFHFGAEERLMARAGYPQLTVHQHLHAEFIAELAQWKAELENGSTLSLTLELQRKLTDWLQNHIGRADRSLATFLRDLRD